MSKLHLPVVISKRGVGSRNNRSKVFDAVIGDLVVEGPSQQEARHRMKLAVMQIVSHPCTFVQVAQDGTVFTIQIGVEPGTASIKSFRGNGGETAQVGTEEIAEVEKGQRLEWILKQFVLGYDRASNATAV